MLGSQDEYILVENPVPTRLGPLSTQSTIRSKRARDATAVLTSVGLFPGGFVMIGWEVMIRWTHLPIRGGAGPKRVSPPFFCFIKGLYI